jgi:DNA-binding MarR family transcriptional regulator
VTAVKRTPELHATAAFRLGVLGTLATERFTAGIEAHGLKPKHAGLLTVLHAGTATSQQELAALMGVAPSLVVALADQLEALGAVRRVRDPADRRRQALTLTEHGRTLLATCAQVAADVDAQLLASLTAAQRRALREGLGALARSAGLPA